MEAWSDEDSFDEDDFLMDDFSEEESVELEQFEQLADRKAKFHNACTVGNRSNLAKLFMSESELFLNNCDYRSSLTCAVAAERVCDEMGMARKAVETIVLYQLGDRKGAIEASKKVDESELKSGYLKSRFSNTLEVLEFMPQLLSMLSNMNNHS
jgi:hypothetical protein